MTTTQAPDLTAIKRRQQATWASGDFSAVATLIVPVAETLCDATDLRAGTRVLDVATGSGNTAIAAARIGCEVTGIDYVPSLLAHGRERAAAERLAIDFDEGDAENLPYADATFDAVVSTFGAMFAPDQPRAAAEIARVSRPGGRIGLVAWTPEGFLGDMFRTMAAYVPPPAGITSPMAWGDPAHVESLFGDAVDWVGHARRTFTFRFTSPEAFVELFRTTYGPTLKAFESLEEGDRAELSAALAALARRHDRLDEEGAIAIPAEYLESVGIRR
jgi:ubiquinone/menaquinone biosynthesis C-methylase UbiE